MSNFTFGHNVFKSRLLLLRQNASAGGKGFKKVPEVYRSKLKKLDVESSADIADSDKKVSY